MQTHKVRVETNGEESPYNWKVFLDDKDITPFVNNIKIEADVESPAAIVTLRLYGAIELPFDLQAHVLVEHIQNSAQNETAQQTGT